MEEVILTVKVKALVENKEPELLKIIGRELIAGISTSVDQNQNVDDIEVVSIKSKVIIEEVTDLMPESIEDIV